VSTDQLPKDLYSEILPNLFMGGTHDDDVVFNSQENEHKITEQEFDAVVTMYSWAHPTDWGVQEMRYGIPDSEIKHINLEKLFEVAYWGFNRWLAGDRVLVRCQAGLNRSGLITCLILMLKGYSQEQAINLIREKRSQVALFNHNYISWLNMEAFDKLNTFLGSKSADMLDPNSKNLG
jgi:protein-tyrosine phosphatase